MHWIFFHDFPGFPELVGTLSLWEKSPYFAFIKLLFKNLIVVQMFLSKNINMQSTVKPVLSGHSKRRQKMGFKTDYRLMQV